MSATKFTLTVDIGNAAMQRGSDLANTLARVADLVSDIGKLADSIAGGTLRDENGNTVGSWAVA